MVCHLASSRSVLDGLDTSHERCVQYLVVQALRSLQGLEQEYDYKYYMHADDDSYVRLDLLLPLLVRPFRGNPFSSTLMAAWVWVKRCSTF
jgi:hypothetical protein